MKEGVKQGVERDNGNDNEITKREEIKGFRCLKVKGKSIELTCS